MPNKKSFILHIDSLGILDSLNYEQAGRLFKAIKCYQEGDEIELDEVTKLIFFPFKSQFDRDQEKYENICIRNKNNGVKGGRPKTQNNPVGSKETQEPPKNLKNDKDSDSDNEKTRSNGFDQFWLIFPKKVKKKEARKKWVSRKLDTKLVIILADIKNRIANDTRWKGGYVPDPTTYINGDLWDDEIIKTVTKDSIKFPPNGDCNAWVAFAAKHGMKPARGELQYDFERRVKNKVLEN